MIICRGQFPGKMSAVKHIIIEVGAGEIIKIHEVLKVPIEETHMKAQVIIIQTHCQDLEEEALEEEVNMNHMDHYREEVEYKKLKNLMDITKEVMRITHMDHYQEEVEDKTVMGITKEALKIEGMEEGEEEDIIKEMLALKNR